MSPVSSKKSKKKSGRSRSAHSRPSALKRWSSLAAGWKGRKLAIFLDYDGTLTPIVATPDLAVLSGETKSVLADLSKVTPTLVVSGRGREDVQNLVGLENLYYAGSHGFDIAGPKGSRIVYEVDKALKADIERAHKRLSGPVGRIKGALLENKRFSLAVHYRLAAAKDVPKLEALVDKVIADHPKLRKAGGKKVFELRPVMKWDKGKALRWLMKALKLKGAVPIYIGDDVTDEDAFKAISEDGVGILVSERPKPTAARYSLRDPGEARDFLKRVLDFLRGDPWTLVYNGFEPGMEGLREVLCALGNGVFCTRAAAEESSADDVHYPGTYLAGGYNRLPSVISGQTIYNEDLVNFPNWLSLTFRPEGGKWVRIGKTEILSWRQELRLKQGILTREARLRHPDGKITSVASRRLVHMRDARFAAIEYRITPENWSGGVQVRSLIDGGVTNWGVKRYRQLSHNHMRVSGTGAVEPEGVFLGSETTESGIRMAQAQRTRLYKGGSRVACAHSLVKTKTAIGQDLFAKARRGQALTVEKIVAVTTSKTPGVNETETNAGLALSQCGRFADLLRSHSLAWEALWRKCDVELTPETDGDPEMERMQQILRIHAFHALQTASPNSVGLDVSVPARGLHGEAYRGHIFWDEMYIFPFYKLRLPEVLRSLLLYRYHRLGFARDNAAKAGYKGAMFPWQSSSDGREESQVIHLNPRSGKWDPDHSSLQRHINIAVVYNVWQYYSASGDLKFLERYGAELILEICRFWASTASYNRKLRRYEIKGVMGPDEYHEMYPGARKGGLDNNGYTNVMVVWCLKRAMETLKLIGADARREVLSLLDLGPEELARWRDIIKRMRVPFHGKRIISQFEGYEKLKEFDWEGYRKKYGNIARLDRILKAENDSPDKYKLSKQADVVMLFYLLEHRELSSLLASLGYRFDKRDLLENTVYYNRRASHGSTLSKMVFATVIDSLDRARGWSWFLEALRADVEDVQGGTTPEGVHMGAMTGTIDMVVRRFAGVDAGADGVRFRPSLPKAIRSLRLRVNYRGSWLDVRVGRKRLEVTALPGGRHVVPVTVKGRRALVRRGSTKRFSL